MYRIMNETRGIIFDMDGVIIDSAYLHEESWKRILIEYGFPWEEKLDFRKDIMGASSVDSARILFKHHVQKYDLSVICTRKDEIYYELLKENVNSLAVPGFINFFNAAASLDIPVALATSSPFEEAEFVLKSFGIYHRFNAITCISDVKNPKPHPEIYLKTCAGLELEPSSCIGFEDSITGIKALISAGVKCIAVGTSLTSERLKSEGLEVSLYIENFSKLSLDVSNHDHP